MIQYKFKNPSLFKGITAGKAAEELERIREKHGYLSPEVVVDESRDPGAVLHRCFEWDDWKAAELYRARFAGDLIRNIEVVVNDKTVECNVRAFVNVRAAEGFQRSYIPIHEAMLNDVSKNDLMEQAKAEMQSFITKYAQLEELGNVKREMLYVINGIKHTSPENARVSTR